MSEGFQFMGAHPILTFFLAIIMAEVVIRVTWGIPNRVMRHWNIHKHGYPPAHCDADGDFKPKD